MDNASANTLSIPTDASVAFPTGTVLNVYQKGAGITTINAVTSGTTTIVSEVQFLLLQYLHLIRQPVA